MERVSGAAWGSEGGWEADRSGEVQGMARGRFHMWKLYQTPDGTEGDFVMPLHGGGRSLYC